MNNINDYNNLEGEKEKDKFKVSISLQILEALESIKNFLGKNEEVVQKEEKVLKKIRGRPPKLTPSIKTIGYDKTKLKVVEL